MTATLPAGYNREAYQQRVAGYSPEPIRDAAFKLCEGRLGGVLLDAGTGGGEWLARLLPHVERAISVDLMRANIPGVECHALDLSTDPLPCADLSLDLITALELVEHLANPRHFAAECFRALKPGGALILSTPCNDSLTSRLSLLFRGYYPEFADMQYRANGHITPLTEVDLRRISDEAGFSKTAFHYPLPGRVPKLSVHWQGLLPFLRGRLWTDTAFAVLTK